MKIIEKTRIFFFRELVRDQKLFFHLGPFHASQAYALLSLEPKNMVRDRLSTKRRQVQVRDPPPPQDGISISMFNYVALRPPSAF